LLGHGSCRESSSFSQQIAGSKRLANSRPSAQILLATPRMAWAVNRRSARGPAAAQRADPCGLLHPRRGRAFHFHQKTRNSNRRARRNRSRHRLPSRLVTGIAQDRPRDLLIDLVPGEEIRSRCGGGRRPSAVRGASAACRKARPGSRRAPADAAALASTASTQSGPCPRREHSTGQTR